jgi:alkanesulfonate monooxygenase SsuD/methylene tetrahydromethanopterin reductase-like flavin-dependent oxidoreductase (luciferase family)
MFGRRDWSAFLAWVQEAEALGFDSVWAQDHPPRYPDWGTTLAALALATRTIRLGPLVSCIAYRNPVVLAQAAADIDRLSQGRFVLGVGIGDVPAEFDQLGISFPSVRDRQAALAEALEIVTGVWGPVPFTYTGAHFRVREVNVPRPVQTPHVPILIAGGGERVTLRQVARYADVSNFSPSPYAGGVTGLAEVRRKLTILDRYCDAVGRPRQAILRSHLVLPLLLAPTASALRTKLAELSSAEIDLFGAGLLAGTPREVLAHYRALVSAGIQYFIATTRENDFETLRLLATDVLPELAAGA